jgi:hypothetical protein
MMTFATWLVHKLDGPNHWTRPAKGQCWSKTLCLHESELTAWEDGHLRNRPTLRSARSLILTGRGRK